MVAGSRLCDAEIKGVCSLNESADWSGVVLGVESRWPSLVRVLLAVRMCSLERV